MGTGRSRSAAVFTSAKTCHMRSISGTLRNRAKRLLTRKLSPPSGASSTLGDDLAEGGGPGVEHLDPGGVEQVGAQVSLHYVCLGDRVGDRGRGRERDDPG